MNQRTVALVVVVALVLIGGWMLAQPEREMRSLDTDDETPSTGAPVTLTASADAPRKAAQRQAPDETSDTDGTIKGLVLDAESGEPVPKARVFQRGGEIVVPFSAVTVTDQDGMFSLRARAGAPASVVCRAPGYLQAVSPPSVGTEGRLTIRLARGSSIQGRVIDDLGSPIASARVWAFMDANAAAWPHGEEWWLTEDGGQGGTATTDEEGRFKILGLDPGRRFRVRAARPLHTSISAADTAVVPGDDPREICLQLVAVAELGLSIVDEGTGQPIRHAVMTMGLPRGTAMRRPTHYSSLSGETSEQGAATRVFRFLRYEASEVPEKPVTKVRVSAHGYRPQAIEIALRLGARSTHAVKLQRQPGLDFVRVRVRAEWEGGKPFSGPLAVLFWSSASPGGQGVDLKFEDGWSVEELYLPTGKYDITTVGSGPVGVWWKETGPPGSCSVSQTPDGTPSVCRVTLRGAVLRIRVESSRGVPLRGYGLAVVSPDGHSGWRLYWHRGYRASRVGATLTDFAEVLIPQGRFKCYARMPDGRQSHIEGRAREDGELLEATIVIR